MVRYLFEVPTSQLSSARLGPIEVLAKCVEPNQLYLGRFGSHDLYHEGCAELYSFGTNLRFGREAVREFSPKRLVGHSTQVCDLKKKSGPLGEQPSSWFNPKLPELQRASRIQSGDYIWSCRTLGQGEDGED